MPRLRDQGIGSTVVKELLAVGRAKGVELIEINVDEGDTGARRFYERHGFSSTEPDTAERAVYYFQEITP